MQHVWTKRPPRNKPGAQVCINCGLKQRPVERAGLPGWWTEFFTPKGQSLGFSRPTCPGEAYVVCW